ncbi:MAG: cytochrome c oxidase subunit II [Pseudomonadales bacterium]|nr:cytochrome c oxidase subunit II [Pseudomonadales bacterium]MCP5183504.1 cytochrome c oxidase subunit II [Pseudomonadales bacterium]
MRPGVTTISQSIFELHTIVLWICVVIGIIVFGAMFWSIIHHRKSSGHKPAQFHENTRLEILWTIVPTVILIVMAFPSTKTLVQMYDTSSPDMIVEVRGYQWKWQYKYLDENRNPAFSFFSILSTPIEERHNEVPKGEHYLLEVDEPLRIPVNKKVQFLVTSEDVIHSWWVPDFGLKRDAIPGTMNDIWAIVPTPGVYRGQCTELCGKDHGFMPVVVQAMEQDDFDAWYAERVEAQKERAALESMSFTADELMTQGEAVYTKYCASCHQANGQGVPPVFPALAGSPIATGDRDEHIARVVDGVAGTAMQAFGSQLSKAELAAVVHFERHSWGNNAGDLTQPVDVANVMAGN